MNTKSKFLLFLLVVITFGCSVKKNAIRGIGNKGEILKEYEIDGTTYIISKEANDIKQYRIITTSNIYEISARPELLYIIDKLTNSCYKHFEENVIAIDCDKLKEDEYLKEYLN